MRKVSWVFVATLTGYGKCLQTVCSWISTRYEISLTDMDAVRTRFKSFGFPPVTHKIKKRRLWKNANAFPDAGNDCVHKAVDVCSSLEIPSSQNISFYISTFSTKICPTLTFRKMWSLCWFILQIKMLQWKPRLK